MSITIVNGLRDVISKTSLRSVQSMKKERKNMNVRKPKKEIENGDKVKCRITGFEGIVTSICEFLGGCTRIGVKSQKLEAGAPIDTQVFDMSDLKIVKSEEIPKEEPKDPVVRLGDKARCKITGFEGIVTAINTRIDGKRMVTITPPVKDGKMMEPQVMFETIIEKVVEQEHEEPKDKKNGGDQKILGLTN